MIEHVRNFRKIRLSPSGYLASYFAKILNIILSRGEIMHNLVTLRCQSFHF